MSAALEPCKAIVASEEPEHLAEEKQMFWPNEPTTLDDLHALYALEQKFAGRVAGTTLYVTSAERKDGVETETVADQTKKLFMASWLLLIVVCWALVAVSECELNIGCEQTSSHSGVVGLRGGARRRHHPDG